jgi:dipeptidyl-peptidase-3
MDRIASISQAATELWAQIGRRLLSKPPFSLGFPSETTTSAYYPGPSRITKDEVSMVSRVMEQHQIFPENTRLRKTEVGNTTVYDILQASVETDPEPRLLPNDVSDATARLVRGDHAKELALICVHLREAAKYAANPRQQAIISKYCESFQSGDLEIYRDSLREWVADRAPRVENIFGFVEPYRDPHGVRAEWEALVAIPNAEETKALTKLVQHSKTFIRRLPWAKNEIENDGQGPFEKESFDPPDFASIHSKNSKVSTSGSSTNGNLQHWRIAPASSSAESTCQM